MAGLKYLIKHLQGQHDQKAHGHGNRVTMDSLREELLKNEGEPFVKDSISIQAYRVGSLDDPNKRGIFFSGDEKGAQAYSSLHQGQEVKEYDLNLENVLIAGHQNSVTQLFFNKSYNTMNTGGVEGARKLDKKIMAEAKKRKLKAVIFTRPAPPAEFEIMVFDKKDI